MMFFLFRAFLVERLNNAVVYADGAAPRAHERRADRGRDGRRAGRADAAQARPFVVADGAGVRIEVQGRLVPLRQRQPVDPEGREPCRRAGRVGRDHRPVGKRQDDAAASHGRPARADPRRGARQRPRRAGRSPRPTSARDRRRHAGRHPVPGHGRRQHLVLRHADRHRARRPRRRARPTSPPTSRRCRCSTTRCSPRPPPTSRAARSSASSSPARSITRRASSSSTKRRATSTRRARRSSARAVEAMDMTRVLVAHRQGDDRHRRPRPRARSGDRARSRRRPAAAATDRALVTPLS